jgi:multidrug resistance efflux pump
VVIDPTDYKIAVSLNEAAVQQAQANAQNAERESQRRQEPTTLAITVEEKQTCASNSVAVSGAVSAGGGQAGASAGQPATDRNPLSSQRAG